MGFEDFDQMDTWDAGKTAGGRHGSMPSKKRMKNLTDKVLVTKTKRKAKDDEWVSSKDIKTKRVSEKRAGRMEKRGWKKHQKLSHNTTRSDRTSGGTA